MATRKKDRIIIWIIAGIMLLGTLGSFAMMVLTQINQPKESAYQQEKQSELQKKYQEYLNKTEKQKKELHDKYFELLSGYKSRVAKFNKDSVKEVKTEDLKIGDGEEVKKETKYSSYYIGWNPDGEIFDQSLSDDKLKDPLLSQGLIKGWAEGTIGMKMGGVREITIPAEKAYGEAGSGDKIKPNTPIKFVVIAIPTPENIEMPQELTNGL